MSQSLCRILVHVVFSTKNRIPFLIEKIRGQVLRYMAAVLNKMECQVLAINGTVDHLHVFIVMFKGHTVPEVVEEIKRSSSRWIKREFTGYRDFSWQSGYAAFSVSESQRATVENYIKNQEKHHHELSFQDEFRAFLKKHHINYNEAHVWD